MTLSNAATAKTCGPVLEFSTKPRIASSAEVKGSHYQEAEITAFSSLFVFFFICVSCVLICLSICRIYMCVHVHLLIHKCGPAKGLLSLSLSATPHLSF